MAESHARKPEFGANPSAPRANRALRILAYLVLLLLACAAIWWIDRGAMLTNSHPIAPAAHPAAR